MKLEEKTFEEIYLIFVNDFLTIEKMAEHYQVDKDLLKHWIDCGNTANNTNAEEWEELQDKINDLYFNLI
jgi:adenine-specific DNA glycosylase